MRLVPRARISDEALQVAVPQLPTWAATPLPPRSLTHVTLLILRSSVAEPAKDTEEEVVANVAELVGAVICSAGTALSTRTSASSRSAAFGSLESDSLEPPQAARMAHAAATGASLRWNRKLVMKDSLKFGHTDDLRRIECKRWLRQVLCCGGTDAVGVAAGGGKLLDWSGVTRAGLGVERSAIQHRYGQPIGGPHIPCKVNCCAVTLPATLAPHAPSWRVPLNQGDSLLDNYKVTT
jgi:hypothetical protein